MVASRKPFLIGIAGGTCCGKVCSNYYNQTSNAYKNRKTALNLHFKGMNRGKLRRNLMRKFRKDWIRVKRRILKGRLPKSGGLKTSVCLYQLSLEHYSWDLAEILYVDLFHNKVPPQVFPTFPAYLTTFLAHFFAGMLQILRDNF